MSAPWASISLSFSILPVLPEMTSQLFREVCSSTDTCGLALRSYVPRSNPLEDRIRRGDVRPAARRARPPPRTEPSTLGPSPELTEWLGPEAAEVEQRGAVHAQRIDR